ncbi:hypothetical protein K438DRAFT_1995093 [Mycena galopus ATCC 62051]|nr:hypothetical protein K438DRAFT_1995093 [Mycena galopus ATCC 62051]
MCHDHHAHGCPPFIPITFTLNPPSNTHPGSAPCTQSPPAYPNATQAQAPTAVKPVPSPFGPSSSSSTSSIESSSVSSAVSSTDSLFLSDADRTPKKEPATPTLRLNVPPRVTMETRVQLSPTGHARGAALVATPAVAPGVADPTHATIAVTPPRRDYASAPPQRDSVRITPQPGVVAAAPGPAALTPDIEPPFTYGIRGVAVFCPGHAAAWAGARRLGMKDPKIFSSRNPDRVQAYMYGLPFEGED